MTDRVETRRARGAADCLACARSFINAEAAAQHVRDIHDGDDTMMVPLLKRREMLERLQGLYGYGPTPAIPIPANSDHAEAMARVALHHLDSTREDTTHDR